MCPIQASEFVAKGKVIETKDRVNRKDEVLSLLQKEAASAFTQREIAERLNMGSAQAHSVLIGLVGDNKVKRASVPVDDKHSRIYYTIAPQ